MKPQPLLAAAPRLALVLLLGLPGSLPPAARATPPDAGPPAAASDSTTQASVSDSQVVEGFINVPVEQAWRLFTTPAGYQVAGVGNAEVELRIGGLIRTVYAPQAPVGSPRPNSNRDEAGSSGGRQTVLSEVLAYEPQRMLATRIRQPAANFAYRDAITGTWSVMYFNPSGPDMTQVRIVGLGYRDEVGSQALRKFLADANQVLLDRTAKHYWPKCKLCEKESGEPK